jgi:1,4-dihydroxy-2-naphthoate octaprenyltransferase
MSPFNIILLAIRPKTLPAAVAPVMIGTSMAFGDGVHHFVSAAVALITALLIQIGTNLANDYFDFKKGTDTRDRIGPIRVTEAGLVKPGTMKIATAFVFFLAWCGCMWLFMRGGKPVIIIGILSISSGIFYTAGPRPLGYLGLGELFVLIFFGPVAVAGTYYVQSLEINAAVIIAGLAPGLFSSAILVVNNLRDIEGDARTGKKTLAVRFGADFAKKEFLFFILSACVIPAAVFLITHDHIYTLLAVFSSLFSLSTILTVLTKQEGTALNHALAKTGLLLIIYSVIFSVGWIV